MSISNALVVDDSRLARIALSKLLKAQNIVVDMANSGDEAIKLAIETKPDVIFMDFMMPEMDGYETTKKLFDNSETADIPVVMCTSQDTEEDRKKARDSGAKGFLTKPTTQTILNKVIEALNRRQKTKEDPVKPPQESISKREVQSQFSIDQIKSVAKHAAEQIAIQAAENAAEKTAHKVAVIAAEDALSMALKEMDAKIVKLADDAASSSAEAIAEQVADKTSRIIVREALDELAEKAVLDISERVESSMTESLQKELSQCLEEFIAGDLLKEEVRRVSRVEAEGVVNELAERVARSAAEEVATIVAERVGESTATEIAKVFSRQMAEETANRLFNEKEKLLSGKMIKIGFVFSLLSIAAAAGVSFMLLKFI